MLEIRCRKVKIFLAESAKSQRNLCKFVENIIRFPLRLCALYERFSFSKNKKHTPHRILCGALFNEPFVLPLIVRAPTLLVVKRLLAQASPSMIEQEYCCVPIECFPQRSRSAYSDRKSLGTEFLKPQWPVCGLLIFLRPSCCLLGLVQ